MKFSIDRTDIRILNELQQDSSISNVELARRVSISAPSCLRRVRRLKERKIILGNVALIDHKQFSASLSIILEIQLERERNDLMDHFKRSITGVREISQCYVVTGDADFILVVNVRDINHYNDFLQQVIYSNNNVRKLRSLIVMNRVKFDTMIEIYEQGA